MKKLSLLIICLLLLVGCGEKEELEKNKDSSTTTSTKVTTTTSDSKTTSSTTTSNKKTTKESKTTTAKKLGKNEYISIKDGKIHKYTFVYNDKDTCEKNAKGETPYDTVYPVHPYAFLGCEEVKDDSGKTYYGIYYLEHTDENSKFYY